MSDAEMTPESEAPKGGVPQDVADSVMALRNEAQAMARAVDRGWKITAVVFAVIVLIIAGYLYVLVYRPLKENLQADAVVQMGFSRVDGALGAYGAPPLRSPAFPEWAAQELQARAPEVMQEYVRPELESLPERLPELRAQLVSRFRQNAPQLMDRAVNALLQEGVPRARSMLLTRLKGSANEALDQIEGQFEEVVSTVVAAHRQDVQELGQTDWAAVRGRMEQEFEREMGPILDQVFEGLTAAITSARQDTELLVRAYRSGELTEEQKLEIQLIRLVRALFRQKAAQPEVAAKSLFQQIMDDLRVPEEVAPEFSEIVSAPAGVGRAPTVDEIDWGAVPAEHREAAKRMYEEAMRKAPTQAPVAPGAPGSLSIPEPDWSEIPEEHREEVREQLEKSRQMLRERMGEGAEQPDQAPPMPSLEGLPEPDWSQVPEEHREQAKKAYEEGLKKARESMEQAQE